MGHRPCTPNRRTFPWPWADMNMQAGFEPHIPWFEGAKLLPSPSARTSARAYDVHLYSQSLCATRCGLASVSRGQGRCTAAAAASLCRDVARSMDLCGVRACMRRSKSAGRAMAVRGLASSHETFIHLTAAGSVNSPAEAEFAVLLCSDVQKGGIDGMTVHYV